MVWKAGRQEFESIAFRKQTEVENGLLELPIKVVCVGLGPDFWCDRTSILLASGGLRGCFGGGLAGGRSWSGVSQAFLKYHIIYTSYISLCEGTVPRIELLDFWGKTPLKLVSKEKMMSPPASIYVDFCNKDGSEFLALGLKAMGLLWICRFCEVCVAEGTCKGQLGG